MNFISGRMRLLAAASSALVLAACNSITDTKYKPFIPEQPTNVVLNGTVTGLSTRPLVLQLSLTKPGASAPTVSQASFVSTGTISFSAVPKGSAYAVTIAGQPYGRTCVLANGSGTANTNVTNLSLTCTRSAPTFTVSGTVVGLPAGATGLKVQLVTEEGTEVVPIAAGQTTFTFAADSSLLLPQFAYTVSIKANPTANGVQDNCAVVNGTGTIPNASPANVTNVQATCSFAIGGTTAFPLVFGPAPAIGAGGVGLSLSPAGGGAVISTVSATGASFQFPQRQLSNASAFYTVAITSQPTGQTCVLKSGGGAVSVSVTTAADVNSVGVACISTPALANQLVGTYRLGRDVLTFFADGTFLFGTHPATGGAAASGVEQGFYGVVGGFTPAGAQTLNITTEANGAGGLSNVGADFGYVNLTGIAKTATTIAFSKAPTFGGAATGPFTYTAANSTAGKLTGAWVTANAQRVFVYNSADGTGFHMGVNSGTPNLQDVCLTITDPTAATGNYTQNRSGTCVIAGGVVDTDPTAALGASFGLPGGPPLGGGANPAIGYTVTAGAPDTLVLQPTGGTAVSFSRSVPN